MCLVVACKCLVERTAVVDDVYTVHAYTLQLLCWLSLHSVLHVFQAFCYVHSIKRTQGLGSAQLLPPWM